MTQATNRLIYRGFYGFLQHSVQAKFLKADKLSEGKKISEISNVMINVWPFRLAIKYEYQSRFGLPRCLTFYTILPWDSQVFKLCRRGHIKGVQELLTREKVSPLIQDQCGRTLLHAACKSCNPELCELILHLGVSPDHCNAQGQKALGFIRCIRDDYKGVANLQETVKLLVSAQEDVSSDDLRMYFCGPWRTSHMVTSMALAFRSQQELSWEDIRAHALVSALGTVASQSDYVRVFRDAEVADFTRWETTLRGLLNGQVGPACRDAKALPGQTFASHSPVRCMTLIDILFKGSNDPLESGAQANIWLILLRDVGIDVNMYLREEEHSYAQNRFMTLPCPCCGVPRKLAFRYGDCPVVTWEWCIDPSVPGKLVCQEFLSMNHYHWDDESWEITWPFRYPDWWDCCEPLLSIEFFRHHFEKWQRSNQTHKERLVRRAKKRLLKQQRANGTYKQQRMPGSWPG